MYRTVHILQKSLLAFIGGGLLLLILLSLGISQIAQSTAGAGVTERRSVLLDAGHGGVDPGAIGVNGVNEKDVNLSIALTLRDILRVNGYTVRMTRDSDIALNDPQYTKISAVKTSDLKKRLKLMEEDPSAVVLSIHQNKFGQEQYHGAQMFYGRKNEDSRLLAECLQQAFRERLQPENAREIKRSTSDVYIVHNATVPVVLAECGFLSNREECALLCEAEYQKKVAFTLYCGLEDFYRERRALSSPGGTESGPE